MAKVAIVTGASGNLGQAVAKKFLSEGYNVIGTVYSDSAAVNHPAFEQAVADLSNEENAEQFAETIIKKYGHIDVAVLTVGGFAMGSIAGTKTADVMKQVKLNFETAYNSARPVFIQMLKQNGGKIFLIGSRPGLHAKNGKGMIAYSLAKSMIFHLAELLNEEGKQHNVVTSVIVPGTIDTPQNRETMPDANFDSWVKAEAIAEVIYFYCTDKAEILKEPIIKVYGNS